MKNKNVTDFGFIMRLQPQRFSNTWVWPKPKISFPKDIPPLSIDPFLNRESQLYFKSKAHRNFQIYLCLINSSKCFILSPSLFGKRCVIFFHQTFETLFFLFLETGRFFSQHKQVKPGVLEWLDIQKPWLQIGLELGKTFLLLFIR